MASRVDTIFYNGSGYADPTAATAIRKVLKDMNNIFKARAGEIWAFEDGKLILVIAVKNSIMNYTTLNHEDNGHTDIRIGAWYANSSMIAYTWADKAVKFVRTLTDEEFDEVLSQIGDNLGLTLGCSDCGASEELAEKIKEVETLKMEYDQLMDEFRDIERTKTSGTAEECIKLRAEIEVLQKMYASLLERVMG